MEWKKGDGWPIIVENPRLWIMEGYYVMQYLLEEKPFFVVGKGTRVCFLGDRWCLYEKLKREISKNLQHLAQEKVYGSEVFTVEREATTCNINPA